MKTNEKESINRTFPSPHLGALEAPRHRTKSLSFGNGLTFATLALACFAVSPIARAVTPAPDGDYPNFNTAEGQAALFSLTSGQYNTAVGYYSLFYNTTGYDNTANGAAALEHNTMGHDNTADGVEALFVNTTGSYNTAIGVKSLDKNANGGANTAPASSPLSKTMLTTTQPTAIRRLAITQAALTTWPVVLTR
jgi:hypothetical protein